MKSLFALILVTMPSLLWGCAGAIDAAKTASGESKGSSPKEEPASDPIVVTGAYLACEDVTPKVLQGQVGGGNSEIACNLMTSAGVPVQAEQNITMTAALSVGQVYQEKALDFTQTPHVKFIVASDSVPVKKDGLPEPVKIYPKNNQAAAVTVTIKKPLPSRGED